MKIPKDKRNLPKETPGTMAWYAIAPRYSLNR